MDLFFYKMDTALPLLHWTFEHVVL